MKGVARPKPVVVEKKGWSLTPTWVWPAYYAMCALFIVEGGGDILQAFLSSHEKILGQEIGLSAFSYIEMFFGGVTALIGIGLLVRIEVFRAIVNFVCALRILRGLAGLLGGLGGTLLFGALGLVVVLMNLVTIATAAFMIYLIGETEKSAPNL